MVWNLLSLALLFVFVVITAKLLVKGNALKNKYSIKQKDASFVETPLVKEETIDKMTYRVFENPLSSKTAIKQFAIQVKDSHPELICDFVDDNQILGSLSIDCFDQQKKFITSLFIDNIMSFKLNPIIELPLKTEMINIQLHQNNDLTKSSHQVDKQENYKKLAKQESFALFFLLLPLSYFMLNILVELFTVSFIERFMTLETLFLGLTLVILSCILHYIIMVIYIYKSHHYRGETNE